MNLHSNFIQNSSKLETAQCLSTEWTDAVTLHLGILLSNTRKKLLIHITNIHWISKILCQVSRNLTQKSKICVTPFI